MCQYEPLLGDRIFLWLRNGITKLVVAVAPEERESDGESKRTGIRSESELRDSGGRERQGRSVQLCCHTNRIQFLSNNQTRPLNTLENIEIIQQLN